MTEPVLDVLLKTASQGGPVLLTLALLAVLCVRYLIPMAEKALVAHQSDLQRIIDASTASTKATTDAFREALDRIERQNAQLVQMVSDKIGGEVVGIRRDLDKAVDVLEGLRTDLAARTGEFPRLSQDRMIPPKKDA